MPKFTTVTLACLHAGEVTLGQCQIYPPLVGVALNNQGDCFQSQITSHIAFENYMICKIIINVTEQTAPKITKTLSLQTFTYLPPSTSEASIALDTQKLCYK